MASHADVQTDWEGLVIAALENADKLPTALPHRISMEGVLGELKTVKALQGTHRAGKQKATQDLGDIIARGKDLAVRLRGAIKADLGLRTEELVNYGILPRRARVRRPPEVQPPTGPELAASPDKTTA